ncbi:MAG TPA: hypothetical protein VFX51_28365 [Solirubrobacteraceae bacterium]|nr:hypothetical protein [Solirubrobacteraceae bacterium]
MSTRDLASTPPEDTARTTDQREEVGTESREGAVATADERDATAERGEVTADAPVEQRERESSAERDEADDTALLPDDQGTEFHERWESIQTTFVDDPRNAVENADALVAELMQRLADGFARERERLEGQWSRGEDVSTEDLRVVLQRYRSFFRRLLSA